MVTSRAALHVHRAAAAVDAVPEQLDDCVCVKLPPLSTKNVPPSPSGNPPVRSICPLTVTSPSAVSSTSPPDPPPSSLSPEAVPLNCPSTVMLPARRRC